MSISATARRWIEAANLLDRDPTRSVRCPERDDGTLVVHDEVFPNDPTMMERYLTTIAQLVLAESELAALPT